MSGSMRPLNLSTFALSIMTELSASNANPFSFGGTRNELFDPAKPRVVRWSRHPLLAALALWAAAHVVPNGDLAHLILFGTFAAFAFLGGRLIDRRKRHEMGPEWQRLVWLSKARRACPGAGWEAPLRGL